MARVTRDRQKSEIVELDRAVQERGAALVNYQEGSLRERVVKAQVHRTQLVREDGDWREVLITRRDWVGPRCSVAGCELEALASHWKRARPGVLAHVCTDHVGLEASFDGLTPVWPVEWEEDRLVIHPDGMGVELEALLERVDV